MKQNDLKKFLKETGLFLADILYNAVIIVVLVIVIRGLLISPFRVVGSSMSDTLQNKDFILIDKLSYLIGDIDRGDPIVFLPPATSKDAPKFEESVTTNPAGLGTFRFSELTKLKDDSYCSKFILKSLWFCHDSVRPGDIVYVAPQEGVQGSTASQTQWDLVQSFRIEEGTYNQGFIQFKGVAQTPYAVRVYDSEGPEYYVKRVIGIPGDTVMIDGGRVYIKTAGSSEFVQIQEPFLNSENAGRTYISQQQHQNTYEVPDGNYFVLGDNRNHSNDSRSWLEPITQNPFPFVPESNISGKVMLILWPLPDLRLVRAGDLLPLGE